MKSKIRYYNITQGHLITAWQIIHLVSKYDLVPVRTIVNIASQSGIFGGTVPTGHALRLCVDYGFLSVNSGIVQITDISKSEFLPLCKNDDPNFTVLRRILYHIISYHNFHWLIYYDPDPTIFKEYLMGIDPEWVILLDNARLFDFSDSETIKWWNDVFIKYSDYKNRLKKAIGDVGEKLTYLKELDRISRDGYIPSNQYVKWASNISDRFGFDILSIRGKLFPSSTGEKDQIRIEVKSSDSVAIKNFKFYISKPEWNTALTNLNSYFFFCWTGINIEDETAKDGPFAIPASHLLDHVPIDKSDKCEWSECRCIIDLSKYKI